MAQEKKKQKFFEVEIPIINKKTELYAYDQKELENKYIKYDLTRMMRGKGLLLTLKVKLKDGKLVSYPKKMVILPYFIRRVVKKGTNYVEDSFIAKTKDNEVILKPFLVTRRKVSRNIRKSLRNKCKEELLDYVKDKNSEALFEDLLKGQLQRNLSQKLKKIYPLSFCDIRILEMKNKD
ncbi:hypothetical protein GYA25_00250 [Candidatus Woesearchaeota archaeon]|jgi:ribosomal protein S3AE|nr:hypothetical protein [Candidatus Woesearchaeota archaeon]